METNSNPILELTLDFSLDIIDFAEMLESRRKYVISRQILKAGTSIGANVHEAQSPESKADFIHKMKISDKESRETEYWLKLCQRSKHYPNCEDLMLKLKVIQKILSKIIGNSRNN
ncbi:MAG: four helix bundle protein [Saprospiraceae bacterium]